MYISAGGALANSYQQDVEANNLANANTVGYKPDIPLMKARGTEAQHGSREFTTDLLESMGGGTFALPTHTDFTPASLKETQSKYDLALAGEGFFQVQNGSEVHYTRDGRFMLDEQNQLVTLAGQYPVLDRGGQPIIMDPDTAPVIDMMGFINQGDVTRAQLGIVNFDDTRQLKKTGGNLFKSESTVQPRNIPAVVKQGFLEDSGVNSIDGLTHMMKIGRMFQMNTSMLQIQNQTLQQAVSKLGSITG